MTFLTMVRFILPASICSKFDSVDAQICTYNGSPLQAVEYMSSSSNGGVCACKGNFDA